MKALVEIPSMARQGYGFGALLFRSRRARRLGTIGAALAEKLEPVERLESMFARPLLEAADPHGALALARQAATGFLHTLLEFLKPLFQWLEESEENRRAFLEAVDLEASDSEPGRDDPPGVLAAWRCKRDLLTSAEFWRDSSTFCRRRPGTPSACPNLSTSSHTATCWPSRLWWERTTPRVHDVPRSRGSHRKPGTERRIDISSSSVRSTAIFPLPDAIFSSVG